MAAWITNNTIAGNTATYGGGIWCGEGDYARISNNIVVFNAGGIYRPDGVVYLRNNDVYGNTAYDYSGVSPGQGDISLDPLFVDADGGDYHIQGVSPCVDAGYDDAPGLPATDVDGEERIQGLHVDIGADETTEESPPEQVATPTFDPPAGTYGSAQDVTISCSTDGAHIHYTTDGSDPTEESALYSVPVEIAVDTTIKARAYKADWTDSEIGSAAYVITEQVATPTFDPPAGTYGSAQDVTISCATDGASIYYTTDGSDPTEESALYSTPVEIAVDATLKARAYKADWTDSEIGSAAYVIIEPEQVATPTFDPPAGTYTGAQQVGISCATEGAIIYFTTDRSEPSDEGTPVTGGIRAERDLTVKAKAYKMGWIASEVGSAAYVIVQPEEPATRPARGMARRLPGLIVAANLYVDNSILVGRVDCKLPAITPVNTEISGGGTAGTMNVPLLAVFEAMEAEITFRTLEPEVARLMNAGSHQLAIRGAQDVYDTAGGRMETEQLTVFMTVLGSAGFNPEKIKPGESTDSTVTAQVSRMQIRLAGEEIAELDSLNMVYRVAGVDQLAQVRAQI